MNHADNAGDAIRSFFSRALDNFPHKSSRGSESDEEEEFDRIEKRALRNANLCAGANTNLYKYLEGVKLPDRELLDDCPDSVDLAVIEIEES